MSRAEFEVWKERVVRNETTMNDKFKELISNYDSEDES